MAFLGLDGSCRGFIVPFGGRDFSTEGDVFAGVENFVNVLEVFTDLGTAGKAFCKVERAVDFGYRQLIDRKLGVYSCSWVGVVPPYAAKRW